MAIQEQPKDKIIKLLQVAEYENEEYNKLIFSKILPLLNINETELNKLNIDMFNTVICKKINVLNDQLEKYSDEVEYFKKENSKLTKMALLLAKEISSMQENEQEINKLESDESSGEDIEFTDDEEESDWSEHSSDRDFIDDSEV